MSVGSSHLGGLPRPSRRSTRLLPVPDEMWDEAKETEPPSQERMEQPSQTDAATETDDSEEEVVWTEEEPVPYTNPPPTPSPPARRLQRTVRFDIPEEPQRPGTTPEPTPSPSPSPIVDIPETEGSPSDLLEYPDRRYRF